MEQWLDRERDQLALWIPVGLGAGIAGWFTIASRDGWIAFLLALLAGSLAVLAVLKAGWLRRTLLVFQMLMIAGCLLIWWRAEHVSAYRLERPQVVRLVARVETVELLAARDIMRLTLKPASGQGLPERIRVNVATGMGLPPLQAGATVRLKARLMPPASAALPGAYDFAQVAWFRRLGATGTAIGPIELIGSAPGQGLFDSINRIRARLTAHVRQTVDGSAGGIAASLITGDQGGIAEADAEAMRISGLAHLLSISGLHVGAVVAGTMLLVLRLLALSPRLALYAPLPLIAATVAAIAGVAYTLLAGAEVPTIRSCVAALLVLIALAIGREAMTLRLVGTGALVVLLFWPEALVSPSFQLSFAAVTALVAFNEHQGVKAFARHREEDGPVIRAGRFMLMLLVTGLIVEVALAPIALYHFHRAGIYGSLANMIAIPLTTFVIMPVEALALLGDALGLGAPFWMIVEISLNLLINIARFVADQPGAVAALPVMPNGAFALMLVAGLWLCLWRGSVRWLGALLFVPGAAWAGLTAAPDLLVTGDGRHIALRDAGGQFYLLRPRAGDYVRDMIGSVAADQRLAALDHMPQARCNADLCVAEIEARGRRWRLLATRSPYLVDRKAMVHACTTADIVVSDRRLPKGCVPRWLKADRLMLEGTGGLAIRLDPPAVEMVRQPGDEHPWVRISPASYPK
jgi:competence protein ComEC